MKYSELVKSIMVKSMDLNALKKLVINHLKKQEKEEQKKELSKALAVDEIMQKANFPVGTIREWKGKKYKKIAPGKWARMYDTKGRGTNIAVGKLIARVNKIDNVEDLMKFCLEHKQRFADTDILEKIRAAVDAQNEKLSGKEGSSKTEGTPKKEKNISLKDLGFEEMESVKYNGDYWKVAGYGSKGEGISLTPDRSKGNLRSSNEFVLKEDFSKIERTKEPAKEAEDTKTASKGKLATDKQIDYVSEVANKTELSKDKMIKKPVKTIQRYANSHVEDFQGGIDKFIEYMADRQSEISLDEIGKEWARLVNHNIARQIWKDYQNGSLEINDDGYFQEKKEELPKENEPKTSSAKKQQEVFDKFEKASIKNAGDPDREKLFAKHNYYTDGHDWTIATDGHMLIAKKEKFDEPEDTKKIANMEMVFNLKGSDYTVPNGIDEVIKNAPKKVVTGTNYKGKEVKEDSVIKFGNEYIKTDYLKQIQGIFGSLKDVKVISGGEGKALKFEKGDYAVVVMPNREPDDMSIVVNNDNNASKNDSETKEENKKLPSGYVSDLPIEKQGDLGRMLKQHFKNEGMSGMEIADALDNAMDSKISDLEEIINSNSEIKNLLTSSSGKEGKTENKKGFSLDDINSDKKIQNFDEGIDTIKQISEKYGTSEKARELLNDFMGFNVGGSSPLYDKIHEHFGLTPSMLDADWEACQKIMLKLSTGNKNINKELEDIDISREEFAARVRGMFEKEDKNIKKSYSERVRTISKSVLG